MFSWLILLINAPILVLIVNLTALQRAAERMRGHSRMMIIGDAGLCGFILAIARFLLPEFKVRSYGTDSGSCLYGFFAELFE